MFKKCTFKDTGISLICDKLADCETPAVSKKRVTDLVFKNRIKKEFNF